MIFSTEMMLTFLLNVDEVYPTYVLITYSFFTIVLTRELFYCLIFSMYWKSGVSSPLRVMIALLSSGIKFWC